MVSLIQHFEADFLWKVSLKILNSGMILKTLPMCIYRQAVKALMSLQKCTVSSQPPLLACIKYDNKSRAQSRGPALHAFLKGEADLKKC